MEKKTKVQVKIQNATVRYYFVDKPFNTKGVEFDENGKSTNGALGLTVLLDADAPGAAEAVKLIGKNKSVSAENIDGKLVHKITAKTRFKPTIADSKGDIIEALTDVRINQGDVMKVTMVVTPYTYKTPSGTESAALNLNILKILSHDTSKRVEVAEDDGSKKAEFLASLKTL